MVVQFAHDEKARPLVRDLAARLDEAAEVNARLLELEDQQHGTTGGYRLCVAWPELLESNAGHASRLSTWVEFCRDEGLLAEPEEADDEE